MPAPGGQPVGETDEDDPARPGTRTISAIMASQSATCSSTLEEKHTSTAPVASGNRSALAIALPGPGRPRPASSPLSVSRHTARAPAMRNSRAK